MYTLTNILSLNPPNSPTEDSHFTNEEAEKQKNNNKNEEIRTQINEVI